MQLTRHDEALLLLTIRLGKQPPGAPTPLSAAEWGRLAQWLNGHSLAPADLLRGPLDETLAGWADTKISLPRLEALLNRTAALGLALDRWTQAGVWIVTRASESYPSRLKKRLRTVAPPVLFGIGSPALLERGGVAVVGSRHADESDLALATQLGAQAAEEGVTLVSGGARGIDEAAMRGAVQAGGSAVAVVADTLLRKASHADYRRAILEERLTLLSPYHPEAGFDVGNAMGRNRYIYCLADGAVVVCAEQGTGGTWNGAVEALAHQWVPVWVAAPRQATSGTAALEARGARRLPEPLPRLATLFDPLPARPTITQPLLFETQTLYHADSTAPSPVVEFYDLFLERLRSLTAREPATLDALEALQLHRSQLKLWLNRAVEEQRVRKLVRPVRYEWRRS